MIEQEERIDSSAFHGVNGYGHGDVGREKLDNIVAKIMGAEAALVRLQLFSGTHAIATALFGSLRPGDNMLCVSGHPYDTLEEVIGQRVGAQTGTYAGSLMDWGIGYSELELAVKDTFVAEFDIEAIDRALVADPKIKLVHIQRYRRRSDLSNHPALHYTMLYSTVLNLLLNDRLSS